MSHQDHGRCNGSVFHFQALNAAISWLWKDVDFSNLTLRDDCTWSARALATTALLWAWSDELTLGDRFRKARQITCKSLRIRHAPATSYQGFIKLLNRWTPSLLELLQQTFRRRMKRHFSRRMRIAGFFAFGADGSRIEAPRTSSNEAAYSTRKNHSGKKKRQTSQATQ